MFKRNFLAHEQRASREWLFDDAAAFNDLGKILRRTIHDRYLEIVDFDEDVVDVESAQCCQKMFDSREHHTGSHQRGCVTTVRDRLNVCRNLKAAKIGATKDVPSVWRCGNEAYMNRDGSV